MSKSVANPANTVWPVRAEKPVVGRTNVHRPSHALMTAVGLTHVRAYLVRRQPKGIPKCAELANAYRAALCATAPRTKCAWMVAVKSTPAETWSVEQA